MIIVGLNSGTSRDGISATIFETTRLLPTASIRLILHQDTPYPRWALRKLLELEKKPDFEKVARANFFLGEVFADAALKLISKSRVKKDRISLVASHGQTIGHFPELKKIGRYRIRATLQLAESSVIAARTGITTVSDFRPADISAGGEGAPVLAYSEYLLFASRKQNRMVINLGGIANFSLLPRLSGPEKVHATDAGPCNLLLDGLASRVSGGKMRFDPWGKIALSGRPRPEWVRAFLDHNFFAKPAPKTSGREEFGGRWLEHILAGIKFNPRKDGPDLLRSGAAAVAEMIAGCCAQNYPRFRCDEIIVSGGGARNLALLHELQQVLGRKIILSSALGIPLQAKEPIGFGLLGELCLRGMSGNLPFATGAKSRAVLGKIVPGRNFRQVLGRLKIEAKG